MSKLDDIKPDLDNDIYKVEFFVAGEWVMTCGLSKESILKVTDYAEMLSDRDNEAIQ